MKYLMIMAAFLLLAACEKDGAADSSGEAMSNAISNAMDEPRPEVVDEVMDAAKDAGDATMADMAETMGSTIDDAKEAVVALEEAMTESDEDAEMDMEQAKKLIGE